MKPWTREDVRASLRQLFCTLSAPYVIGVSQLDYSQGSYQPLQSRDYSRLSSNDTLVRSAGPDRQ